MKNKILASILLLACLLGFAFVGGCQSSVVAEINAVVQIEFSDVETPFSSKDKDLLKSAFIQKEDSLKNFIYQNSNGKVSVDSRFLTTVKLPKPVDYFMPKYSYDYKEKSYVVVNEIGYDNRFYDENGAVALTGKPSVERFFRERELLTLATQLASEKISRFGSGVDLVNLTLIPSKLNRGVVSGSVFWPHQAKVFQGSTADLSAVYHVGDASGELKEIKLADKSINGYILIPYAFISDGKNVTTNTLCHEYMHVLGAPEMYSLTSSTTLVGEFDILGGEETATPNLSLSYVRKQMGWLEEGEQIKGVAKSGEYELTAVESAGGVKAYKIALPDYHETGECFYVEYRMLGKGSLSSEPTDGVIVYRVNEKNGRINASGEVGAIWQGNAYKDEIYLFRFDRELGGSYEKRKEITKNGICYATLADKFGYTIFGNQTGDENAITYSNGKNTGVTIEFLSKDGDKAKVKITLPQADYSTALASEGLYEGYGNRHALRFGRFSADTTAYVVYTENSVSSPTAKDLIDGKYGQVKVYQTALLKVDLPKFDGFEKFVYLCYKTGEELSSVKTYKIVGVKNIDIRLVGALALVFGIGLPAVFFGLAKRIGKSDESKNTAANDGENEQE